MYEILGEALDAEKSSRALMAIVKEGDTRALSVVLANYGKVRTRHDFPNERVDSSWALRTLSAHSLLPQHDHYGSPYKDDAGHHDDWKNWLAENGAALPKRSPLIVPFNPLKLVAEVPISGCAEHIAIDGRLLFVGGRNKLEIFDISGTAKPVKIGSYHLADSIEQMAAWKGNLLLTAHQGGLYVYGYTPEGDLRHLFFDMDVLHGSHFMIRKDRLLVSNHVYSKETSAFLYEISSMITPRRLDTCDGKDLQQFSFSGEDGFFTTAAWSGARIDTASACPIRTIQKRVWPGGTALADNGRFYCIDHGLLIVRDLGSGKLLCCAPARAPYDAKLAVRQDRAYAVLEGTGIVIYDVSNPANITVLSHTNLPGGSRQIYRGLCVTDKHIYCANYQGQLLIFELPRPL